MDSDHTHLATCIVIVSFCCLLAILVGLITFYQLFIQDSSEWINRTYRNLTITIMMLFIFTTIGDLIHAIIKYINFPHRTEFDHKESILIMINDILYFLGDIAFYVLILLRISLPFELNKCISIILIIFVLLFTISSMAYAVTIYMNENRYNDITNKVYILGISASDLLLNGSILFIFIYKMKKTIINIDPTLSKEAENNVNLMTNVITKHSLLFGIAIIINQGFYMTLVYGQFLQDWTIWAVYILSYTIRSIENMINVVILWLILRINYNKYIKLCKCCHICIGKCCFKNIDSSTAIQNPYRELVNNNL